MKKNILGKIIFCIILFAILTSCKKDDLEYKNFFGENNRDIENVVRESRKTSDIITAPENQSSNKKNNQNVINEETSFYINENNITNKTPGEMGLNDVMPNFRNVVYSKSYLMKFDDTAIMNAYNEIQDRIMNAYWGQEEQTVARFNYEVLEEYLQLDTNVNLNRYQKLEATDYNNFLHQDENDYGRAKGTGTTNLSVSIDLSSMVIKDSYYEFDATFYKPVRVEKSVVSSLELEDKMVIKYPHLVAGQIEVKDTIIEYDGGLGFTYKENEDDENFTECYLKELNDYYYAFYEGEDRRVDIPSETVKLKVLKNSNIGYGTSFKMAAVHENNYRIGLNDERHIYRDYEVFDPYDEKRSDNILFKGDRYFSANYIMFDDKGYATDLYYFSQE